MDSSTGMVSADGVYRPRPCNSPRSPVLSCFLLLCRGSLCPDNTDFQLGLGSASAFVTSLVGVPVAPASAPTAFVRAVICGDRSTIAIMLGVHWASEWSTDGGGGRGGGGGGEELGGEEDRTYDPHRFFYVSN